jgi:hypothetical protein
VGARNRLFLGWGPSVETMAHTELELAHHGSVERSDRRFELDHRKSETHRCWFANYAIYRTRILLAVAVATGASSPNPAKTRRAPFLYLSCSQQTGAINNLSMLIEGVCQYFRNDLRLKRGLKPRNDISQFHPDVTLIKLYEG